MSALSGLEKLSWRLTASLRPIAGESLGLDFSGLDCVGEDDEAVSRSETEGMADVESVCRCVAVGDVSRSAEASDEEGEDISLLPAAPFPFRLPRVFSNRGLIFCGREVSFFFLPMSVASDFGSRKLAPVDIVSESYACKSWSVPEWKSEMRD